MIYNNIEMVDKGIADDLVSEQGIKITVYGFKLSDKFVMSYSLPIISTVPVKSPL